MRRNHRASFQEERYYYTVVCITMNSCAMDIVWKHLTREKQKKVNPGPKWFPNQDWEDSLGSSRKEMVVGQAESAKQTACADRPTANQGG